MRLFAFIYEKKTYTKLIYKNYDVEVADLPSLMDNQLLWKKHINTLTVKWW